MQNRDPVVVKEQDDRQYIVMIISGVICVILIFLFLGWLVQVTWNYTLPDLFGIKTIQYGQALALMVLLNVLLGSIGSNCAAAMRPNNSK